MKIVIDIQKHIYEHAKEESEDSNDEWDAMRAIANGTPIPKNHGRLIDADAIEYTHAIARSLDDGHNWNELCVTKDELYNAPTIIEADKENKE